MNRVLLVARGWVIAVGCLVMICSHAVAQGPNRISYWRTHYEELTPAADARVKRAHKIFARLVQAAGTRRGVTPHLLILKEDPWGIALPIALPDGWIVVSKSVLSLCDQEPELGDDRLAFVLGHELAHLMQDHFWHIKFFQSLELPQGHKGQTIKRPDVPVEDLQHQEFQADTNGILYATMAGFSPQAIVSHDGLVNFFQAWIDARDPSRIGRRPTTSTHPSTTQRGAVLQASLLRVVHQAAAFQTGLWWLLAGDYPQAVRAFEYFLEVFPSREVYHNLALSHHKLALQAYQLWKPNTSVLPFQLALAIEPVTRASRIYVSTESQRGNVTHALPEDLFHDHLDSAIDLYRQALTFESTYTPAALNLAHALIVRSIQRQTQGLSADVAEAQAVLLRAQQNDPDESIMPQLLNALGVVSFYAERITDAKQLFIRVQTLDPSDAAPLFNLTYLAQVAQQPVEVKRYQLAYQQLLPSGTDVTQKPSIEQVMGISVGHFTDEVPSAWGKPTPSSFALGKTRLTLNAYPGKVMTLSQDNEILMVQVQRPFSGTSTLGVKIGNQAQAVLKRYGLPNRRLTMPRGATWSYDRHRIAFEIQNGQVVGWLVY